MTDLLRRILGSIDRSEPHVWCYDDITMLGPWPRGALEFFLELGVLKEVEPSSLVWLWECEEPDWVEPMWLPDAVHGGRVMGFYQCRFEWCGMHVVETDRRRQWSGSFEGIVRAVAKAIGITGPGIEDVPDRVYLLGSVTRGEQTRDVFVVRGIPWPDGAATLARAQRLCASPHATVLCLGPSPLPDQRPASWRAVLSLEEIAAIEGGKLAIPAVRLFEHHAVGPQPSDDHVVLTEQDIDVLEALNEHPREAMELAMLMAASGYGKKAVRATLKRLVGLGLVCKPKGTKRKGVALTDEGVATLAAQVATQRRRTPARAPV